MIKQLFSRKFKNIFGKIALCSIGIACFLAIINGLDTADTRLAFIFVGMVCIYAGAFLFNSEN